ATEPRAAATVAGDLLIEKSVGAGADESAEQRQMLGQCAVEVKLISGLIVGRVVFCVEVKPGECGQLEAVFAAEIAGRRARLEGPVVLAVVGEGAFSEVACGRVNPERPLPLQVTFDPTEHQRQKFNVSESIVGTTRLATKSETSDIEEQVCLHFRP